MKDDMENIEDPDRMHQLEGEVNELHDWLEFKRPNGCYINVNRSQIEYVTEGAVDEDYSEIGLKSGNKIVVDERYEKIMEMI